MGFWDAITDLVDAATPWSVADAEAPPAEDKAEESKVRNVPRYCGGRAMSDLREPVRPWKRDTCVSNESGQCARLVDGLTADLRHF